MTAERSGSGRPARIARPAFLFFGVFTSLEELFGVVRERIVERYGPLHPIGESPTFPFPPTRTYRATMGPDLLRRFFVLRELWPQEGLAPVKRHAVELEDAVSAKGRYPVARPVNIDPGILNDCRVILASTKDQSHRIYRGDGIWEEVTLRFEHGEYRPLPWTYPDFRAPTYHGFFEALRRELLRSWKVTTGPPRGQ